jgi:hypothetical protein
MEEGGVEEVQEGRRRGEEGRTDRAGTTAGAAGRDVRDNSSRVETTRAEWAGKTRAAGAGALNIINYSFIIIYYYKKIQGQAAKKIQGQAAVVQVVVKKVNKK